jgi:hypothetical protein
MTRNLYLGANLDPVVEAAGTGDPGAVIRAVSDAWVMIEKTNFPERAEVLAEEIEASEPMLVGLQEAQLYRTGPQTASRVPRHRRPTSSNTTSWPSC